MAKYKKIKIGQNGEYSEYELVGSKEVAISSTQPTDEDVMIWFNPDEEGGGGNVTPLQVATSEMLGSIKADIKTEVDTVPVRIDAEGRLWVEQAGVLDINQIASQLDIQSSVDEAGDLTFKIVVKDGVV